MNHPTFKWLAAAAIALVLSSGHLLSSSPSELDAVEDVAAEVASLTGGEK